MKEGLPSSICATCIERLRVAYEFRNICLQSDQTLQRYLQEDSKSGIVSSHSLHTPTKFDFTLSSGTQDSLPCEETHNEEYIHLKHFLDTDEELPKEEPLVDGTPSRSSSPDNSLTSSFLDNQGEDQLVQIHTVKFLIYPIKLLNQL